MNEFKSPYKQLNRKVNTWCKYTKRLDTYGCGCQHDCDYCYAKSLLNFRGFWGTPKPANIRDIRDSIYRLTRKDIVRLGGMTDCFQPAERANMVTYETIKLLNNHKINYLIVTKSDLVADSKYMDIYDNSLAHFQITITSTEDNDYEKAPSPKNRIKAIERLYHSGFDVCVRLSPFLFDNINLNILNKIKCDKILIEFLKVNPFIKKVFKINYNDYSFRYGGFEHLQLSQKIKLCNLVNGFSKVSVGEYVKEHYEYFRDNLNYNPDDCCNLDLQFYDEPQLKLRL